MSETNITNQPRGNKRQFGSSGFNNNQDRRSPRGGQGGNNPGAFKRQNFGDRGPFNKGNNRNFSQWNKGGGGNDRFNNRGPRNFNRGGFQNANGRQNFNPNFNKPLQHKGRYFQNPNEQDVLDEQNVTESQRNKLVNPEQVNNTTSDDPNSGSETDSSMESDENDTSNNVETSGDDTESSGSEDEMETNAPQNDTETEDSENEPHSSEKNGLIEEKTKNGLIEEKTTTKSDNSISENASAIQYTRLVYVSHLPVTMNRTHIKNFFERYGKIQSVGARISDHKDLCAWITFEKQEDALKALEVNGMEYKRHNLRVNMKKAEVHRFDPSRVIYVGDLPSNVTRGDLWTTFESLCGSINDIKLCMRYHGSYAFIEFHSPDSAEIACSKSKEGVLIKNHNVQIRNYAPGKSERRPKKFEGWHGPRRHMGFQKHNSFKNGPKRFSNKPQRIQVHKNKNANSFTITLGRGSH